MDCDVTTEPQARTGMTVEAFKAMVKELGGVLRRHETARAYAVEMPDGRLYTILDEALDRNAPEDIRSVLAGEREPRVLRHMSRIVGYFSVIENWNQSKVGELRARRRGNYDVADRA
jgi:hypothetical protein